MVAPVWSVTAVLPRTTPSRWDPVWAVTAPETTQTMFEARAPPVRVTLTPVARMRSPATWKIQAVFWFYFCVIRIETRERKGTFSLSKGLPAMENPVAALTAVVHL